MARVSAAEIERIKAEISLEELAERAGVELKKLGADLHGRCPFHDDAEPSLVVTPSKGLWHCLGECQAGGSVIDWVMRAEGVSYRHALLLLKERIPSLAAQPPEASKRGLAPKQSTVRKRPSPLSSDADQAELMDRVVRFYSATLKESPEALDYLKKRGLDDPELIEHFRLGFANRTLSYRLPQKNRQEGAKLRAQLQEAGILRESGHEHFNGSLVIPVFDEAGQVAEMYGRKVGTRLRKGTPLHLYLPGPHRGIFNRKSLLASYQENLTKELILCESLIDALTFWAAGFRNVTASFGVEGFTDELRAFIVDQHITRVLIAYDSDKAGDKAADKLASELSALGVECSRVRFPKGMDANEYALKVGPAGKALQTVLDAAEPMGKPADVPAKQEPGRADNPQDQSPPASPPPATPQATKREMDAKPGPAKAVKPSAQQDAISSLVAPEAGARKPLSYRAESDEGFFICGARRWRVRGMGRNRAPGILRLNLLVQTREGFFVDSLDLYSAKQRAHFIRQASAELHEEERVFKEDLGHLLLALEQLQSEILQAQDDKHQAPELSAEEYAEALRLLKSEDLLTRVEEDLSQAGLVGERRNKLLCYLAATSRKLIQPLAIVVQSSSAAGKSSLMDGVLRFMPDEERMSFSAMTGQSLFYMGETNLSHKILSIAEESGAERAAYALKLLQSEGELSMASTGKDPVTGKLITQEYRVEGPVMLFLTTTSLHVDEELLNRCLVLSVDESREQTEAILMRQRSAQSLDGLFASTERSELIALHQNAQRLLRPFSVVNPFAEELSFSGAQTRSRRDHMKYLGLIQAIALLHQYQRPVKVAERGGMRVEYIEVRREDIRLADELLRGVLDSSFDQLPPKTRELLRAIEAYVHEQAELQGKRPDELRFSRRELRQRLGLGDTQLKLHLGRLVELELLSAQRERHAQRLLYALRPEPALCPAEVDEPLMGSLHEESTTQPVPTGRVPVGVGGRPVFISDTEHLNKPVGVNGKRHEDSENMSSSYPTEAALVGAAE